ncbi:alginate lyase family protein [Sphingorhabdus arenilitoris]|uniref:Alginate lyase family protein n=1 Tax=Sphingorhabdus arenilitoris TaxID=1490041 RepID=A0ABV8RHI9_9SPHN
MAGAVIVGLTRIILAAAILAAFLPVAARAEVGPLSPLENAARCSGSNGYAADFDGRRTFLWRPQWLRQVKADEKASQAYVKAGEKALRSPIYSVTDKPKLVPGATAHDYASIGPYWWPDPKKKSGLPYIRRDGQVNPERDGPEFDKDRLRQLSNDARDLAIAYYLTGDERYAEHSARQLRAWFITPATRMSPHFNFAQGIPGKLNGRGEGIIEASHLSTIVEAIGLLQPSPALTALENKAIEQWYREFATWMATSDIGGDEMRKTNNHGVFFDFYLTHFALYGRLDSVAANIVTAFPQQRLAVQMDRQGRFLAELKRTRSWHYAHFVVDAAARIATIGECAGLDLWSYELPDGRGMNNARSFLEKYWADGAKWPFPDIDGDKADAKQRRSKSAMGVKRLLGYVPADDKAEQTALSTWIP